MENESEKTENVPEIDSDASKSDSAVPANEAVAEPAESVPAPKKKRRWLKRILIALAAFSALVIIVVAFFLGPIVKFGVNTFGASMLGLDKCHIGSAKIYPFGGYVRFENILIGKPSDGVNTFSYNVLSLDFMEVDVEVLSLLSQKKIIDRLEILNLSADYEQLLNGETNIGVMMKNLLGEPKEEDEKEEPAVEEEPEKDDEPAEEIYIGARYFVIKNVKVGATLRGIPTTFPSMSSEFENGVGIDEDLTPVSFGMTVGGNFVSVIDFFRKSVVGDAFGSAANAVSDAAGATADAVSGAAGATADAVSGAAGATVDAVSGAAGSVVDFFSGSPKGNEK